MVTKPKYRRRLTGVGEQARIDIMTRYPGVKKVPSGTLSEYAIKYNCSRENIRQALKAYGVTGTMGSARRFPDRKCARVGCSTIIKKPGNEKSGQTYCSQKCSGMTFRGQRGANPGPWFYKDVERTCAYCKQRFTWTSLQQRDFHRNMNTGHIKYKDDHKPSCTKACAVKRGVQLREQHRDD